jgi:hypothetical protein
VTPPTASSRPTSYTPPVTPASGGHGAPGRNAPPPAAQPATPPASQAPAPAENSGNSNPRIHLR